ncbi:MAG: ferredoxin family protein [Bacteroidales bacterium]|nr:ferredoxin family protein [Bacteroidales bacterium]
MNTVYICSGIVLLWLILGRLHRRRNAGDMVVRVVGNNCSGCRRCVERCSRHVLEMTGDEKGIRAAVKYPDKCTACGHCLEKCKFNALELIERT